MDLDELRELIQEDPELGRGVYVDNNEKAWIMGVIDPLTGFTLIKKFEYVAKGIQHGQNQSCVPPDAYANRFQNFMRECFSFE